MKIYVDATTLIALGTIDGCSHLTTFDGEVAVFPAVLAELTTEPARTNVSDLIENDEIAIASPSPDDYLHRARSMLDESTVNGDVHLIAAVLRSKDESWPVAIVSADRRIRTVAGGLGAAVTGTIGVVVRAVEEGLPPDRGRELVERIDAHGLHMTAELREKAYSLVNSPADRSPE